MSNIHVVSASPQKGRQKISISISLAIILVAIELLIALLFTRTHFGFIPVLKAIFMGSNSRTCKNLELKKKCELYPQKSSPKIRQMFLPVCGVGRDLLTS